MKKFENHKISIRLLLHMEHPWTTWLFVTIKPLFETKKPVPEK